MASPTVNHLAKVRVAGSNPVVRSNEVPGQRPFRGPLARSGLTPATGSATVRAVDAENQTLTDDEIDTLITAVGIWESEFRCAGDDWSAQEALVAKLLAMKSEPDPSDAE